MMQLSVELTIDTMTKAMLRKALREVNRAAGNHIVDTVLRRKFTTQAYMEYPGIVRNRGGRYTRRKQRQVGHNIPNVLTGRMKMSVLGLGGSRVTATANGGRVYIRNYFPMREAQRQELEVMNNRDRKRIADFMGDELRRLSRKPEYQRKRRVKRKRK